MSADAGPSPLSKVDSAVQGLSSSPKDKEPAKRRASSSVPGVFRIEDLGTFPYFALFTLQPYSPSNKHWQVWPCRSGRKGATNCKGDPKAELVCCSSPTFSLTYPMSTKTRHINLSIYQFISELCNWYTIGVSTSLRWLSKTQRRVSWRRCSPNHPSRRSIYTSHWD